MVYPLKFNITKEKVISLYDSFFLHNFYILSTKLTILFHLLKINKKSLFDTMNCTPFVRQYDILNNKWGDFYAKRRTK